MGFAESSGDAFTYLIEPENQTGRYRQVSIRSNIKMRQKNIGKPTEYMNDDSQLADFFLSPAEHIQNNTEAVHSVDSGENIGIQTENAPEENH